MRLFNVMARLSAQLAVTSFVVFPAIAGPLDDLKAQYKRPLDIPFPENAPYSPQIATLGKMLFFDPRLSGAKNMNCASCHNPSFGYEVPVPLAIGAANTPLARQAPTILNAAWTKPLFWDGRAETLEEQAAGPITADVEMNGNLEHIVNDLSEIADYKKWFTRLFPDTGLTQENILTSIATYERTLVSGWAPFDRWVDGTEYAISASAKRGFELFNGKAGCAGCHTGWNFTDNQFHDIGIPSDDIGRGKLEPYDVKAQFAFKTPSLRNLTHRGPYMHDGSIDDLTSMVVFYESGGIDRPSRSDLIKPFELTDKEREDLVAFLESLTAEKTKISMPVLPH